jgi:transcriptional regulator with XRE-family HTH domain
MIKERVVALRQARGWGQTRLAREAHITRDLIAKIERGDVKYPRLDTLCKLKHALQTETIDELVTCPDDTPDAA